MKYTPLKIEKTYKIFRSQFVLFEVLHHNGSTFFYLHSWYSKYGNAFITHSVYPTISADCAGFINALAHDYTLDKNNTIKIDQDSIDETILNDLVEGDQLSVIRDFVVGRNVLLDYRVYSDNSIPSTIDSYSLLSKTDVKTLYIKPGIRIPSLLLPKTLFRKSQGSLTLSDLKKIAINAKDKSK
ncbi:MAG: hypothetical protein GX639_19115 [Fibrobacter sp.]|nr:hypothetical protein [Fibrobacter sp.]